VVLVEVMEIMVGGLEVGLEGKVGRLGDTGSPHFFALLSAAKPLSAALTVTAFGLELSNPQTRAII